MPSVKRKVHEIDQNDNVDHSLQIEDITPFLKDSSMPDHDVAVLLAHLAASIATEHIIHYGSRAPNPQINRKMRRRLGNSTKESLVALRSSLTPPPSKKNYTAPSSAAWDCLIM